MKFVRPPSATDWLVSNNTVSSGVEVITLIKTCRQTVSLLREA